MTEFLIAVVALVLGIVALNKIAVLDRKVAKLKMELGQLGVVPLQKPVATKVPKAKPAEIAPAEILKEPEPVVIAKVPTPTPPPLPARNMEQALASRWFVWIGGVAIAIGGLLFVKYAFDHSLISPTLQIIVALVVAAILSFAGDRMLRSGDTSYVPAALSGAGLAIAFGAIFAAYGLYDLVSPSIAFVGLGLVGLLSLWLSLKQGPFIAALGLAGSFATPTLIQTANPNAWTFFPYLLIILAASFAVLRKRPWWWLGYIGIAGSAAWAILWMHGPFVGADVLPLGLYALAFGAISFFAIKGRDALSMGEGSLLHPTKMSPTLQLGAVGAGISSLILALLVFKAQHGSIAIALFTVGMIAVCGLAWFKRGETGAALGAALLTGLVFMGWPHVSSSNWGLLEAVFGQMSIDNPVEASRFLRAMLGAGAAYMVFGVFGIYRKIPSLNWAWLAAGAPAFFVAGAALNAKALLSDRSWAAIAIGVAAVLLAVIYHRRGKLSDVAENKTSGILAVGAAAGLWFGAHMLFEGVELTLAISALAFAFAYLTRNLAVRLFGPIAAAFGSIAALRLFFSRELWTDDRSLLLGQHWPLYGYGIPVVLFWFASRMLKSTGNARSSTGLEAVSLGLLISLVSVELRVLIGGGVAHDSFSLLEVSSHLLAWLGGAYALLYRQEIYSSFTSKWGSRILLGVSALGLIGLSLLVLNPIVTGDRIEGSALINTLWLAYLAPVVLLALMARKLDAVRLLNWRPALGILCLVLVVAFVTLEVKRLFQGPYLIAEFSSDAESYAMSAAWLVLAVGLLIAGLRMNRKTIRYGGLAVMILALLKTFAYDLWQLGGLWQIASVMGIGLSLVGIGWLYTKFIRPAETASVPQ
jgi:uncharacterized membrane protein